MADDLIHCPSCSSVRLHVRSEGYATWERMDGPDSFQDERGFHFHDDERRGLGYVWTCDDCRAEFSVMRLYKCEACEFGHEPPLVKLTATRPVSAWST